MTIPPRTFETLSPNASPPVRERRAQRAEARIVLVVLAFFLLGAASGAYLVHHSRPAGATDGPNQSENRLGSLSDNTKAVLHQITSPVELRFYSVLDPASTADSLRAFATRVDQFLLALQREANGKISLTRSNSQSYANYNAALTDGMKPFNEEKGEPSFLGIAVLSNGQKSVVPQLAPEWELALEADMARAILAVMKLGSAATPRLPNSPKMDSSSVEEVKRLVPNLESVSLEDATRILRQASFKEFAATASQLQVQLKDAEERLKAAQNGGLETEQQTAMKNLQQVQSEQTERLKQLAAKAQAQIEVLKQLKLSGH